MKSADGSGSWGFRVTPTAVGSKPTALVHKGERPGRSLKGSTCISAGRRTGTVTREERRQGVRTLTRPSRLLTQFVKHDELLTREGFFPSPVGLRVIPPWKSAAVGGGRFLMANHDLPCTVTVAATATEVTVNGHWTRLCAWNLGTVPVYVRTDGTAAVVAADQNYALPAGAPEDTDLPCSPSGGELATDDGTPVTVLSLIATSGTALVHLRAEED